MNNSVLDSIRQGRGGGKQNHEESNSKQCMQTLIMYKTIANWKKAIPTYSKWLQNNLACQSKSESPRAWNRKSCQLRTWSQSPGDRVQQAPPNRFSTETNDEPLSQVGTQSKINSPLNAARRITSPTGFQSLWWFILLCARGEEDVIRHNVVQSVVGNVHIKPKRYPHWKVAEFKTTGTYSWDWQQNRTSVVKRFWESLAQRCNETRSSTAAAGLIKDTKSLCSLKIWWRSWRFDDDDMYVVVRT